MNELYHSNLANLFYHWAAQVLENYDEFLQLSSHFSKVVQSYNSINICYLFSGNQKLFLNLYFVENFTASDYNTES